MSKRILILIIITIFLFGCKSQENINDSNIINDLKTNDKISEKFFLCEELNNKSILNDNIFVTGKDVYIINFEKLFSNNTNCKKIGELKANKIAKYISKNRIIDNDGNVYRQIDLERDNYSKSKTEEIICDTSLKSKIIKLYGNENIISSNEYHNNYYNSDFLIYDNTKLIGYHEEYDMNDSYIDNIDISNIKDEKIIK